MKFRKFIDNSTSAFHPCLTEKPLSALVEYDEQGMEMFSHLYIKKMERDQPVIKEDNVHGISTY